MACSPNRHHQEGTNPSTLLHPPPIHSPNSSTSSRSTSSAAISTNAAVTHSQVPPPNSPRPPPNSPRPPPVTRSEPANPYPTTFVQADTSSFKQVVQMLTGSAKSDPSPASSKAHSIPPIKTLPKKSGSGFKLYERRNSLKNLKINPLIPFSGHPTNSGFSPRNTEILSPSILDFPALVLSPVTPLNHDPFARSPRPGLESPSLDSAAEQKAIRERGFFLHPSPATTPRGAEPQLLPLFPVTSPRVSGSSN